MRDVLKKMYDYKVEARTGEHKQKVNKRRGDMMRNMGIPRSKILARLFDNMPDDKAEAEFKKL